MQADLDDARVQALIKKVAQVHHQACQHAPVEVGGGRQRHDEGQGSDRRLDA